MARRDTRQEAETLKAQLEERHPGLTIVVEEEISEIQMHPFGLGTTYQEDDIIRYEEDIPVIKSTIYHIFELVNCPTCGTKIKNIAIGESITCYNCQSSREEAKVTSKPAYGDYEGTGWMDK